MAHFRLSKTRRQSQQNGRLAAKEWIQTVLRNKDKICWTDTRSTCDSGVVWFICETCGSDCKLSSVLRLLLNTAVLHELTRLLVFGIANHPVDLGIEHCYELLVMLKPGSGLSKSVSLVYVYKLQSCGSAIKPELVLMNGSSRSDP